MIEILNIYKDVHEPQAACSVESQQLNPFQIASMSSIIKYGIYIARTR